MDRWSSVVDPTAELLGGCDGIPILSPSEVIPVSAGVHSAGILARATGDAGTGGDAVGGAALRDQNAEVAPQAVGETTRAGIRSRPRSVSP